MEDKKEWMSWKTELIRNRLKGKLSWGVEEEIGEERSLGAELFLGAAWVGERRRVKCYHQS